MPPCVAQIVAQFEKLLTEGSPARNIRLGGEANPVATFIDNPKLPLYTRYLYNFANCIEQLDTLNGGSKEVASQKNSVTSISKIKPVKKEF